MNRFHHLKHTIVPNLESIAASGSEIELVLLNYSSKDQMHEGMKDYLRFIESGHLVYYHTAGFQYFHYSHAKNVSHVLASGDYIFNLDVDKVVHKTGIDRILEMFTEDPTAVIRARSNNGPGYGGLLGVKKSHFLSLGGYDEDFTGFGGEDCDLVRRAYFGGCQFRALRGSFFADIAHSDRERLENLDPKVYQHFGLKDASEIKVGTHQRNLKLSGDKLQKGMIIANPDRVFAKATVTKNFSDRLVEVGCFAEPDYRRLPIAGAF